MMNSERIETLNSYIQQKGEVKFSELESLIPDVSSMTLRRDLAMLEERGDIIRIRGGARSIASLSERLIKEESFFNRELENIDQKNIIAKKAVGLIEKGRSLFFDSGTTIMCFARIIPDEHLFILTSAPNIGMELLKKKNITVTLIGGQLSRDNISVSGANSLEFIKNINIDIAFMATSGFSLESGFTTGNFNECELKKYVIKKARKVVMMMDAAKLDQNMLFTFATLKDIDVLVTSRPLPESAMRAAEKARVTVL